MAASGVLSSGAAKMSQVTTPVINTLLANPSRTSSLYLKNAVDLIDGSMEQNSGQAPESLGGFLGSLFNGQNRAMFCNNISSIFDALNTFNPNNAEKDNDEK